LPQTGLLLFGILAPANAGASAARAEKKYDPGASDTQIKIAKHRAPCVGPPTYLMVTLL
jgi:hypothetical protein